MANVPEKVYTPKEVERARNSAQFVGWLQGGAVVVGGVVLWNLMGWIPVVLALGAVLWVLYKVLGGARNDDES